MKTDRTIEELRNSEKILFTEQEVAAKGFAGARTLRNNRHKGIGIPYVKIGARAIRYHRDDLIRWLNSNRIDPNKR